MQRVPAASIQDVLNQLDSILLECIEQNSAKGIFAYVYRRTTYEIKLAIDAKEFENNALLEEFDVRFANYYIQAYYQYVNGEECSGVWKESFDACLDKLTIVQHILLGMSAHINFDLALTTAEAARGKEIGIWKKDFDKVNDILSRIVDELQDSLAKVSPLFFLLDWIGKNSDEVIINFSMKKARGQAWNFAESLHTAEGDELNLRMQRTDAVLTELAQRIRKPKWKVTQYVLKILAMFEEKNIARVIEKMQK